MAEDEGSAPLVQALAAATQLKLPVAVLLDQFLDWVDDNLKSYEWYRRFLELFAAEHGELDVRELKPKHVTNWLAKRKWGPTTEIRSSAP